MIDLYYCKTSNGLRAAVGLAEAGLPFNPIDVDITVGEHRSPELLRLNPAGTVPIVVDSDPKGGAGGPAIVSQSGAILLYAAEKAGKLLPSNIPARASALQWMMFACSDCAGASTGIALTGKLDEGRSTATELYTDRLVRWMHVAEARLGQAAWLAGEEMSLADLALYPVYHCRMAQIDQRGGPLPHIKEWHATMSARSAVKDALRALSMSI